MDQSAEGAAEARREAPAIGHAVVNVARGIWWTGLGLGAVVAEQTGHLVDALVKKGQQVEPNIFEAGKKAGHGVGEAAGGVGGRIKEFAGKIGKETAGLDEKVAAASIAWAFPPAANSMN